MASITLHDLYIHRADYPADYVRCPIFGGFRSPRRVPGEVRTRANGRRVAITRPGDFTTLEADIPELHRFEAGFLSTFAGETVLVREPALPRGRIFYGTFFELSAAEIDGDWWLNIGLTIEQVTWEEDRSDAIAHR